MCDADEIREEIENTQASIKGLDCQIATVQSRLDDASKDHSEQTIQAWENELRGLELERASEQEALDSLKELSDD